MTDAAISAEGVTKRFGDVVALDRVDLAVPAGTVFGLLGPNGAGKTTMVRILTTILVPDEGRASVLGADVVRQADDVRSRIGLAGQYAAVDENLTGRENLRMIGRLSHLSRPVAASRANELLERFGLADAADRTARTYSGGMRRRLDLAAALVHRPPVLFLDEPTTGLDIRSRSDLWAVIGELVSEGMTLLLTTQYLEEADRLANRIAVVDNGRVMAEGTAAELKARLGTTVVEVGFSDEGAAAAAEGALAAVAVSGPHREGNLVRFEVDDGPRVTTVTAPSDAPAAVPGSKLGWAVADTLTIAGRNLRTITRLPQLLVFSTIQPVIFVLLFRYAFGGAIRTPGVEYVDYLMPGIFAQTVTFGALGTGVGLADDLQKGIIERFRSLPMARSAVLGGRIVSDLVRNLFVVILMCVVGYLVGFRVSTNPLAFLGGLAVLLLFACSLSVIFALIGLSVRNAESAQAAGFPMLAPLVFASSAFVPVASMPGWLQVVARHQPLSVTVDAVRALSIGGPTTSVVIQSLAWSFGIIAVFGPLAVRRYRRAT